MTDLEQINQKLDLIIRSLGLDGKHNAFDITREADKVVDIMLKRSVDKKKSKRYNGV